MLPGRMLGCYMLLFVLYIYAHPMRLLSVCHGLYKCTISTNVGDEVMLAMPLLTKPKWVRFLNLAPSLLL